MKQLYERKVTILHSVILQMDNEWTTSQQYQGSFGEVTIESETVNEEEVKMEVWFKRKGEVFLPATVVYNKETQNIIEWE